MIYSMFYIQFDKLIPKYTFGDRIIEQNAKVKNKGFTLRK